jgi:hypothetical protein
MMRVLARIVFAFTVSTALYGAPVGNPAAPHVIEKGFFIPSDCRVNARVGYEGDFVIDANLKQQVEGSGRVDSYSQSVNSGTATLNVGCRG